MTQVAHYFAGVTLLITVYNRSVSLERLLAAFKELHCEFEDIVVSDDGSQTQQLESIKALQAKYPFQLVTTPNNKGLGNNLNKGHDAINTPYTLYVQEDFVPTSIFPACMLEALQYMNDCKELDMVRFYSNFKFPKLRPIKLGLSEMYFKVLLPSYKMFYMYSDNPNLHRSNFLEKFGRYTEGINSDKTEYRMMISFLQNKGKALYYEDYHGIFEHINSNDEPSTVTRADWRESSNFFIANLKHLYRHLKFRYDYFFVKMKN